MSTFLFGQCYFAGESAKASLAFADEVASAARAFIAANSFARPAVLEAAEQAYWGNMSQGTGLTYSVPADGGHGAHAAGCTHVPHA